MQLLKKVDADEVSPVKRGANRKGVILKDEGGTMSRASIASIMDTPWEREGALVDDLRKEGVDEDVIRATVASVRLAKGVESSLPSGIVEKLGREMYARQNAPLNTSSAPSEGDLIGRSFGDPDEGTSPKITELKGKGRDGSLSGKGAGKKVAADPDMDEDDDEVCKAFEECVAKRSYSADDRKAMASNGQAMPGGRYPIPDRDALSDAIHAVGRGKGSHAAIKAHIMSRAKALGATSMLPDTWMVSKDDLTPEETMSLLKRIAKAFGKKPMDYSPDDGDDKEPDDDPDDTDDESVEKGGTVETHAVPIQKEDGSWDLTGVPESARPYYELTISKAAEREERIAKAEEQVATLTDELRTKEIIAKAETEFQNVGAQDDVVSILREAGSKLSPEGYEKLVGVLSGASEKIKKGDLFAEMGSTYGANGADGIDSFAKIEKAASMLVEKSDTGMTKEQAIEAVLKTSEGQALYSAYMAETGLGVS